MSDLRHIVLQDEDGLLEEVEARALPGGEYELAFSPASIMGLARGDVVRLGERAGSWELARPGKNVSVQFFVLEPTGHELHELEKRIATAGGEIDNRQPNVFVASLPRSFGYRATNNLVMEFLAACPNVEWQFGNVHDANGVVLPGWEHFHET